MEMNHTMSSADNQIETKRITENTMFSGLTVPLAIVLVAILIIWGVTKMVSTGRDHRDLINEIETKTFGNKWVNAYELSKLLATAQIPENEIPWVVERLSDIYKKGTDAKSRNFLIVALGALKDPLTIDVLQIALDDPDPKIKFSALTSLGNQEIGSDINWSKVEKFLQDSDQGLQHAAILALSHHKVASAQLPIVEFLESSKPTLRFAAALGLINFKNERAISTLDGILRLPYPEKNSTGFNQIELETLKLNIISAIKMNQWQKLNSTLQFVSENDPKKKVAVNAREALILLKK